MLSILDVVREMEVHFGMALLFMEIPVSFGTEFKGYNWTRQHHGCVLETLTRFCHKMKS